MDNKPTSVEKICYQHQFAHMVIHVIFIRQAVDAKPLSSEPYHRFGEVFQILALKQVNALQSLKNTYMYYLNKAKHMVEHAFLFYPATFHRLGVEPKIDGGCKTFFPPYQAFWAGQKRSFSCQVEDKLNIGGSNNSNDVHGKFALSSPITLIAIPAECLLSIDDRCGQFNPKKGLDFSRLAKSVLVNVQDHVAQIKQIYLWMHDHFSMHEAKLLQKSRGLL